VAAEAIGPLASASRSLSPKTVPSTHQSTVNAGTENQASISDAGPGSTSGAAIASDQAASFSQLLNRLPAPPKSASLPVIFQPVDQTVLDESQQQAVNELRQEFVNTVSAGGSSQNPDDPAYQQKWQQAQSQSDSMLLNQVGYNTYMKHWVMQYQTSLANQ